jgi:hypothetical protein
LEDTANKNRSEISKIFNEIRNKIVERETFLKRQISESLEKEQSSLKQRIMELEDQMRSIQELKEEKVRIDKESMLETLAQSVYRWEIENDANRKVEAVAINKVFVEVKRDDEISNIVRAITPSHLKSTLLISTVSSQIKKQ